MAPFFEKRERAAEGIFVHSEEMRFVARRRSVEALAGWAGETMELDAAGRVAYTQRIVDAFVSGTPEDQLIAMIQTDLERAGKPTLAGHVAMVHAQVLADATLAGRGQQTTHPSPSRLDQDLRATFEKEHPKPDHRGWSL